MAEQVHFVQDGIDRFRDALGSVDHELERAQKRLLVQRRVLQKRFNAGRKDFDKRTRKLRGELQKSATAQWIDALRKDASKEFERRVDGVLEMLQIATKRDVKRIDRKITQLGRKLKNIERARGANGQAQ